MTDDRKKVVVGLSGGVDSASTVLLLQEKDYLVTGLYFDVKGTDEVGRALAEESANQLGIKLTCTDVSIPFEKIVINDFCREYSRGRTPNPCIICNPHIKFSLLLAEADRIGAHFIATGHYANVIYRNEIDSYLVSMGKNKSKDQSYMLYRLPRKVLSRLLLPLGEKEDKEDVRRLAESRSLSGARAKDSQEICFIEGNYQDYLKEKGVGGTPGNFVDTEGNILGRHKGITAYTIGQRKGLGIALGKPAYVTKIDAKKNTVTLGDREHLYTDTVLSEQNFFSETGEDTLPAHMKGKRIQAKIRYSVEPQEGIISSREGLIQVKFDEKQRAATPGQSIVFYDGDLVIGGGIIT